MWLVTYFHHESMQELIFNSNYERSSIITHRLAAASIKSAILM